MLLTSDCSQWFIIGAWCVFPMWFMIALFAYSIKLGMWQPTACAQGCYRLLPNCSSEFLSLNIGVVLRFLPELFRDECARLLLIFLQDPRCCVDSSDCAVFISLLLLILVDIDCFTTYLPSAPLVISSNHDNPFVVESVLAHPFVSGLTSVPAECCIVEAVCQLSTAHLMFRNRR